MKNIAKEMEANEYLDYVYDREHGALSSHVLISFYVIMFFSHISYGIRII